MRVCIVAGYPRGRTIGGAEVAMSVLADQLVNEGLEVHYIPPESLETSPRSIRFHQIGRLSRLYLTVHAGFAKHVLSRFREAVGKGGPGTSMVLSSPLHRMLARGYESALSDANADVYIQANAGAPTAYVANFCKRKKKPFIFRATSLWDADLTFKWGWTSWRDYTKELYLQGVKRADIVAANSMDTARAFAKHIGKDRVRFIPDGFHILPCSDLSREDSYVLWVGRDRPYKRPWLYAELARMLPNRQFLMVGNIQSLRDLPRNLHLLGPMKLGALTEVYSKSKILVNTSEVEGFPNVLIEAGMHGVPYLGFIDPDGVIAKYSLGYHAKDISSMAKMIDVLTEKEDLRLMLGRNARRFVERHRDMEKVIKKWLILFEEVAHSKAKRS